MAIKGKDGSLIMRRILAIFGLALLLASPAAAQQVTTIHAADSSTGADVAQVGDTSNSAIRVSQAGTWLVGGIVAVSQSGTWTVQPGNSANSTAWLVTGTGGTFPATQSGTWTVNPGNSANTTPWLFSLSQGGNTATVNGSGQLLVNCPSCTGTGVSALEDAASANGDSGAPILTVRQDTIASSTSADGDYQFAKTDNVGRLYTTGSGGTFPVTNAGTFVTQENGAALTSLQLIDNLPNTLGSTTSGQSGTLILGAVTTAAPSYTTAQSNALSLDTAGALRVAITSGAGSGGTSMADDATFTTASTSFGPMGGQYKSTRDAVDDNDGGVFAMTAKRAQYVSLETPLAVSTMDETAGAVKSLLVNAAGSAITVGTDYTHDAALTIGSSAGPLVMARASAASPASVSADNDAVALWASQAGALMTQQTYAGVLAVAGNGASGTGVQRVTIANDSTGILAGVTTVTTLTGGGVASDGVDSGNPIKVGGHATSSLAGRTMVASDDRVDAVYGVDGAAITRPHANLEDLMNAVPVAITDGSSTSIKTAAGSGVKWYVSGVVCTNSSSTDVTLNIQDGVSGTARATIPCPAGGGIWNPPVPLGGFTANTAIAAQPSASASTITVLVLGFKSKI